MNEGQSTGVLRHISEIIDLGTFVYRRVIIEQKNGEYSNWQEFQFNQIRVDLPLPLAEKIGQEVIIKYNLKGQRKEKEGKSVVYQNPVGWYIRLLEDHKAAVAKADAAKDSQISSPVGPETSESDSVFSGDDLPF